MPLQLASIACRCRLLLKSLGNRDRGWPLRLWHSRPNPPFVTHTIFVGGSEPSTLCTAANLSLRKQNIILHPTQHTPPNILDCPTACPSFRPAQRENNKPAFRYSAHRIGNARAHQPAPTPVQSCLHIMFSVDELCQCLLRLLMRVYASTTCAECAGTYNLRCAWMYIHNLR